MLESKIAAGKAIEERCKKILLQKNYKTSINKLTRLLEQKHNIPIIISNDYISLLKNPVDAPIEILYCIMEVMSEQLVSKYFEEKEIKKYNDYKYNSKKLKFPLKLITSFYYITHKHYNILHKK